MKKNTIVWAIIGALFIAFVIWLIRTPARIKPSVYDTFATCIKDSGTKFYGAFWCPHCQAQKALFGSAVHNLPYIECSNPDGKSQNQACNDAKVSSYPTWEFPNGTRVSGEQSLKALSQATQCTLPGEAAPTADGSLLATSTAATVVSTTTAQ
ncbi:MAG: hypothetical protein JWL80_286 [Parcubacteria group bacterium]|nr:hypothetical protein [Parcubacteria group bacterium]